MLRLFAAAFMLTVCTTPAARAETEHTCGPVDADAFIASTLFRMETGRLRGDALLDRAAVAFGKRAGFGNVVLAVFVIPDNGDVFVVPVMQTSTGEPIACLEKADDQDRAAIRLLLGDPT